MGARFQVFSLERDIAIHVCYYFSGLDDISRLWTHFTSWISIFVAW